ncbi:hypothetical protein GALL_374520 [mine drainage metagenome]|uniref:Uncharacterized protein n=1 Tax=mine drainage metagenome TaxID=410659 RepID=A0A1J5QTG8_9ZZZZ
MHNRSNIHRRQLRGSNQRIKLHMRSPRHIKQSRRHIQNLTHIIQSRIRNRAFSQQILNPTHRQQPQRATKISSQRQIQHQNSCHLNLIRNINRHTPRHINTQNHRLPRDHPHLTPNQIRKQIPDRFRRRNLQLTQDNTPPNISVNTSAVNGLAIKNIAPALAAISRISGEPSEVTNPNGT